MIHFNSSNGVILLYSKGLDWKYTEIVEVDRAKVVRRRAGAVNDQQKRAGVCSRVCAVPHM